MIKFSVLMSVYYKEKPNNFKQAIDSLLNQTLMPSQIVIVKDGPLTIDLENILDLYKDNPLFCVVELNENQGLTKALNEGLKYVKYDLVARMDSDDISLTERFADQIKLFQDNDLTIVGGQVEEFFDSWDEPNKKKRFVPLLHEEIKKQALKKNPFNHPTVMYKKDFIVDIGGYEEMPFFEDYYLWIKSLKNGARCQNSDKTYVYMRADLNMYSRRGGFKYAKHMLKFRKSLFKIKFYNLFQFLFISTSHFIIAIMPNKIRVMIYKKLLRK